MSKQVYLIRHGIALDLALSEIDETRPLTTEGEKKTQKIAQEIQAIGVTFDLILTSPLLRATQTAEILRDMGLTQTIETFPPLAPDGKIENWLNWWETWQKNNIALVGHQPNLGNWAELLIWGKAEGKMVVKKAGIIGLNCPETRSPLGESELFLLTSPKWLLRD
jgi:phosphohistidine phosphatase